MNRARDQMPGQGPDGRFTGYLTGMSGHRLKPLAPLVHGGASSPDRLTYRLSNNQVGQQRRYLPSAVYFAHDQQTPRSPLALDLLDRHGTRHGTLAEL